MYNNNNKRVEYDIREHLTIKFTLEDFSLSFRSQTHTHTTTKQPH